MNTQLMSRRTYRALLVVVVGLSASFACAFDPVNGDYLKDDPKHIRVMTWNIFDAIGIGVDTTPAGPATFGPQFAYDYVGRICHAFDPDVICFQEVEPSSNHSATVAIITQWADTYFGPGTFSIYVSTSTDNFNRNVILSKYPFADLNGDGVATNANTGLIFPGPGGLPPGGAGGIRGWTQAEIDLPDNIYSGDLYVGNSHLKAGFNTSDFDDRLDAAQTIAYYINEALNKSQATGGDPDNVIPSQPPNPLDGDTPIVLCGDFNEDERTNGRDGPVSWLSEWTSASSDGTDRDDSIMHIDTAIKIFTDGSNSLDFGTKGSGKLDLVMVQDSIATVVREFSYDASKTGANPFPPDLQGIFFPFAASSSASDHLPVMMDLILPPRLPGDFDGDGDVDLDDFANNLEPCLLGPGAGAAGSCADADLDGNNDVDLRDYASFMAVFGQ